MEKLPDDDRFISDLGATLGEVREKMRHVREIRATPLDSVGKTVGELEEEELRRQKYAHLEAELQRYRVESAENASFDGASAPSSDGVSAAPTTRRTDLPLWAKWAFPILALASAVTFGVLRFAFP